MSGSSPPFYCLKKNQNAPRPFEHPPVRGENVKTFRWDHRLQIQHLFLSVGSKALNTSDFFGFRFFGFHFEYGLITDETYSRRQINTGTKFEVSHLHSIFVDIGQSGPSMD